MQEWAARLNLLGYHVCSRWIRGDHEITGVNDDSEQRRFAEENFADILMADIVICRSDPLFFRSGRGGRHVEFGIALATKKRIILIGERENVFHWIPRVEVYRTFEEIVKNLKETKT
jgi:nucleoside 2-deoxyribosyltransferase